MVAEAKPEGGRPRPRVPGVLDGEVVPVMSLTDADRERMFALLCTYYDAVSPERFRDDLDAKDDCIVLRDREGEIQGFSTLTSITVGAGGRAHRGIFSGDTVIAEPYWGQRVLGRLFLRYLLRKKLARPFQPLWWFLISKGYKTYLLMANNFREHYPRYERSTPPDRRHILESFARSIFSDSFEPAEGVIRPREDLGWLRHGIAPITDELRRDPRISFFEATNPEWHRGVELACIARMTYLMPLAYGCKAVWRRVSRLLTPGTAQRARRKGAS